MADAPRTRTLKVASACVADHHRRSPGAADLTRRTTPRHDPARADALVVETRIVPLADGDTERRDRQLRAIVALLRGVLARGAESELPSPPGSDLVSDDDRR